jgi:hypothetical protein
MSPGAVWALLLTTVLIFAVTYGVVRFESARLSQRRKFIEACLPRNDEEAAFFAQCWSAGRVK